ncbi:S1 RNA binding family protein [Arenibacter algicola]|uniref:S1 RNA binding family protein n=1 Tax=Arenibacter algicola TaxID=616991 RepID=A0ABY3A7A9_9FLAO
MNKRELQIEAKRLIDISTEDAMNICKKMWVDFPQNSQDQFNLYDAQLTLKATQNNKNVDFNFVCEVVKCFNENEKIKTDFGWFIFNNYLKAASTADFIQNENVIIKLFDFVLQQNLSSNDSNICPYTIGCIGLAKAHSKNLFNANRIENLLSLLNVDFLSRKSSAYTNSEGKEVKQPSDYETYYALRTKALLKLESFTLCINHSEVALKSISEFHYNNDLWFKMRIAICREHLGEFEISERLFQELLSTRAGSDKWFLYRDIAELYFEQENFVNAWKYAVDAAFYGNEPHYMINLYVLQARILVKLDRPNDGEILARLIAAVLKEQGWNNKEAYNRILKFYKIDMLELKSVNSVFSEAKKFWVLERYKGKKEVIGVIVFIHRNGKLGKIRMSDNSVYNFHKRDFDKSQRNLNVLKDAKVSFVKMTSFNGDTIAENIKVLEKINPDVSTNELEGKQFIGSIKNITDFGVFVKLDGHKDGLLHKNSLPRTMQETFKERFNIGEKVRVKIFKVTEKGLQLKLEE